MSNVHPSAIIGENVSLGSNTSIGPQVIIEDHVKIGSGNTIRAGAYIFSGTEIGDKNDIHMHAIIGNTPQDLHFKNEPSFTKIGHQNIIREFVTIHRGTQPGSSTVIGNSNYLMAYCHIAHNCRLGDNIVMVNQASLTGHCVVEDQVLLSGMTGLHQYTRVGRLALLSALSAVNKDIPPYMICGGRPAVVVGINVIGLRRAGIDNQTRAEIKQAYKFLYRSGLNVSQAVEKIKAELKSPEVAHLLDFIEHSKRGILDGSAEEITDTIQPKKIVPSF